MLDDIDAPRSRAREELDAILARPFDASEALEYDREQWMTSREALEAAQRAEAMLGGDT